MGNLESFFLYISAFSATLREKKQLISRRVAEKAENKTLKNLVYGLLSSTCLALPKHLSFQTKLPDYVRQIHPANVSSPNLSFSERKSVRSSLEARQKLKLELFFSSYYSE